VGILAKYSGILKGKDVLPEMGKMLRRGTNYKMPGPGEI
jgi:hypothetical protein